MSMKAFPRPLEGLTRTLFLGMTLSRLTILTKMMLVANKKEP
jgi:hypothetical protein